MEISPRPHQDSNSHCSNSGSSVSSNSNGVQPQTHYPSLLHQPPAVKSITRSECGNPYPTTFVQADSSSFKQVVQMLTGSPDSHSKPHFPPLKSTPKRQQSSFKLYERRNTLKNLRINPLSPVVNGSGFSSRNPEILSPSMLDFPSLVLSPVTPLIPDPFGRSQPPNYDSVKNGNGGLQAEAEAKAIKEKGFYLHPSPATTPRESEPRLLPLFPMTSPREPGLSSSSP